MNEVQKKKHFSLAGALKFWDNFDVELYERILKEKNENIKKMIINKKIK